MDAIYEAGTEKVFSQIAFNGISVLCPDEKIQYLHYDTTSKNVYGEYNVAEDKGGPRITYGSSKDKRPELKQFLVELMCVHQNIPILGSAVDGNSSDRKLNHSMLTRMSDHLAKYEAQGNGWTRACHPDILRDIDLIQYNCDLFCERSTNQP